MYYDVDYINDKYNGAATIGKDNKVKASFDIVKDIATESTLYGMETYEKFPTALEDHFGGSQRATVLAAAAGVATSLAIANANTGLSAGTSPCICTRKHGDVSASSDTTCRTSAVPQTFCLTRATKIFTVNPLIKVCFADDLMPFNFAEPRREFGRGAIREFVPAGERSLIIPAK